MIIKSLDQMEQIVKANRELSWDGWTVVQSFPNKVAWRFPNGAFIKGRWFAQKRFEPGEKGWEIPSKYSRRNG
jgi:hypothetical protein